jgi:DNA-binding GntR family transcriptional regulator
VTAPAGKAAMIIGASRGMDNALGAEYPARGWQVTQPRDQSELRRLVELPALRKLADRGLSDQELAVVRKLASITVGPACSGDVPGYLHADMVFHVCLVELTGDPILSEVARLLLAPRLMPAPHVAESGQLLAAAREHGQLADLLADDRLSAADDLLRHHLSQPWAGRSAATGGWPGRDLSVVMGA